jgi:hypothetical protein
MSPARFASAVAALVGVLALGAVLAFSFRDAGDVTSAVGPQFVVECTWSHRAPDDPIVHPGHPGASHEHDFFGNVATRASSDPSSLLGAQTSCQTPLDTAAYWLPTLSDGTEPVEPGRLFAYYRRPVGVAPTAIEPYPLGLAIVAGDAEATTPQPTEVVSWHCGAGTETASRPPSCAPGSPLSLRVVFPACWDGTRLDSDDHRAHIVYGDDRGCPRSHPVPVPELEIDVVYRFVGDPSALHFSSGSVLGAHADFLNGWDPDGLARHVERCLRAGSDCGRPAGHPSG